jgi:hypothetical protein
MEAGRLLDCSLLLGSERYPLCGQDDAVMEAYLTAVHKVYAARDDLLSDAGPVDATTVAAPTEAGGRAHA